MIKFASRPFTIRDMPLLENALNIFRVAVEGVIRDLNKSPVISGNLITNIVMTAGATSRIYHKLGYRPNGWVVTRITGAGALYKETDATESHVDLYSYGNFTLDVWFF